MATPLLMEVSEFLVIDNELEKEAIKELAEIDKVEKIVNQDYSIDIPENLEESKLLFRSYHDGNQLTNMQWKP